MAEQRTISRISTEGAQSAISGFQQFGRGASAEIDRISKSTTPANAALKGLSQVSDNLKGRMGELAAPLGSVGASLAALGPAGLVAGAGIGGVLIAVTKGMQAYQEYERVQLRINNALERTGHISGQTAGSIEGMARSIADNTNASTQSVRAAAEQLLVYQNVTGKTFERALKLSADLAETWGTDLSDAARSLGELLTDPIGAMEELGSRGVFFDEAIRANIKSMQEAGETARLYETLLNKVSSHLQDQGSAAARGYAGALSDLDDEVFETLRRIGELANGTGVLGTALRAATNAVKDFRENVLGTGDPVDDLTKKIDELNKQRQSLATPTNEIAIAGTAALESQVGSIITDPGKIVKDTISVLGSLVSKIKEVGTEYFKSDEERQKAAKAAIKLIDNNISKLIQEKQAIIDNRRTIINNRRILGEVAKNRADTEAQARLIAKETAEAEEKAKKDAETAAKKREKDDENRREKIARLVVDRYKTAEEKKTKKEEEEEEKRIKKALEAIDQRRNADEKATQKAKEEEDKRTKIAFDAIDVRTARAIAEQERIYNRDIQRFRAQIEERDKKIQQEEDILQHREDAIRNAADNITIILERVVEDDWIGALNGFFNFAGEGLADIGQQVKQLGELNENPQQIKLGETLGAAGGVIQGVGAGVGIGQATSKFTGKMGMGSTTGGAVSGAVGGAVAGTMIFPGIGTVIGAVVGAVIGGILGTSGEPATFASGIRTSAQAPRPDQASDNAIVRSPFGFLNFPVEGARGIAGFRDLQTVAKLDAAIAQFLTEAQKARVSAALAGTITGEIKGDEFGAAAAEAMNERLNIIISAAIGGREGQRVSARFQELNPRGDQESRAQMAAEIIGIEAMLQQALNPEELTQFESAAKELKKQFTELRPLALSYGFSLERVNAAEAAAMAQLREVVDTDIDRALTALSDPFKATMDQIAEEGEIRLRNVRAVGGDIKDAMKLNAAIVEDARRQRREQIGDFNLDVRMQILSLTDKQAAAELDLVRQRDQLLRQARELGASDAQVREIFRLFGLGLADLRRQAAMERRFANLGNQAALVSINNPRQGERLNLSLSQQQRRQEAIEGGQDLVLLERLFQAERVALARRFAEEDRAIRQQQAAERRAQAEARRQAIAQEMAERRALREQRLAEARALQQQQADLKGRIIGQTLEITAPLQAAFFNLRLEQQALLKQVRELGLGHAALAAAQRLVNLQTNALTAQQNAQRAGFQADITQQILQIQDPIKAELFALQRSYQEKLRQAREFGVATTNIDKLYLLEREQILKKSVDTNRQQITDFIAELTARPGSSPLAPQTVLANAEREFTGTLGGADAGKFVDAARAYKDSAQAVFGSGPQFFAVFDRILAEARRFGLTTAELGATAADRATQQQAQVQQRQADEAKQHATRMESLMLEQLGLMRQFIQWYQAINQSTRAGSDSIVKAIARGNVGSLAGQRAA